MVPYVIGRGKSIIAGLETAMGYTLPFQGHSQQCKGGSTGGRSLTFCRTLQRQVKELPNANVVKCEDTLTLVLYRCLLGPLSTPVL